VHGVIAAAGNDWSLTGSILTFAFPVFLFVAVGAALWVLYTMPHEVPGLRYRPDRGAVRPAAPAFPDPASQPGIAHGAAAGQAGPAGQATDQQPQPGPGKGRQATGNGAEG
jgi:hypothetical protein